MPRRRKTTEQFIEEARSVHGDLYGYELVDYKTANTKVLINCKIHGVFEQLPSDHLRGCLCNKCADLNRREAYSLTTEQFINNATLVHGNRYLYDKVNYINCDFKVTIKCRIHGEFNQTPYSHVNLKRGCVLCGNIRNSRTQRNNKRISKFKNIVQPDDYKIIPLTKGKFAKVDNEDFERVSRINWSTTINGYCVNDNVGLMHRYIMNTPKNMDTDHANMDKLDNRKSNLRICTRGQNETNKGKQNKETTSKYKGVSWSKNYRKWICQVVKNKKIVYFNTFYSETCAAKMYDLMSKKYHKEFSRSNKDIINENLRQ